MYIIILYERAEEILNKTMDCNGSVCVCVCVCRLLPVMQTPLHGQFNTSSDRTRSPWGNPPGPCPPPPPKQPSSVKTKGSQQITSLKLLFLPSRSKSDDLNHTGGATRKHFQHSLDPRQARWVVEASEIKASRAAQASDRVQLPAHSYIGLHAYYLYIYIYIRGALLHCSVTV